MAKFLNSELLNSEIENLIAKAEEQIIIISPFIHLHEKVSNLFKAKRENSQLKIIIIFGKNEDNLGKSLKTCDFEFFKTFPNIEVRYERDLHAKYYANEFSSILTSMNLHAYSQKNNIEAGILFENTFPSDHSDNQMESVEVQAIQYFRGVIEASELKYINIPRKSKVTYNPTPNLKSIRSK